MARFWDELRTRLPAIVALVVAAPATALAAAVPYRVTDLGLPGTSTAMNNVGQIVGQFESGQTTTGFVYTPGSGLMNLPVVGRHHEPRDINDSGAVVGNVLISQNDGISAFLWTPGSGLTLLDARYPAFVARSAATAINNHGLVVGSQQFDVADPHAAVFGPNGVTDLGALDRPWDASFAFGINDAGQIVGQSGLFAPWRGFVHSPQTGMVGLSEMTTAHAINDAGQVTGWWNGHVFLYTAAAGITDLGGLRDDSTAVAINDAGHVVGQATTFCGKDCVDQSGLFYSPQTGLVELDTLLLPAASGGWHLTSAVDINDRGQILAWGVRIVDGRVVAGSNSLLLTPVPEPATGLLWLAGVAALGLRARRTSAERSRFSVIPVP